ncbi:cupin domain-containing protein [Pedobacter jamesrossensis]|uniref:Cupin domain-containing protein n=1 Tax=Pedobacter jamesrossensis TaxID=1908238 RepID=A0ABV8NI12_9SPHI
MEQNYWLFGTELKILVDEQKSDGHYDLIEGTLAAEVETPVHLHSKYSEEIYVLEGDFTIYIPGLSIKVKVGESVFIPANTPHVVSAGSNEKNRALTVASPSGFAKLIRSVGRPATSDQPPIEDHETMKKFLNLSEAIGDVLLGPPGSRP